MMIKELQVNMLMDLDKFELSVILERSGYLDNKFKLVEFIGFDGTNFVYKTTYYNFDSDEYEEGKVFVYYKNGVIQAEF